MKSIKLKECLYSEAIDYMIDYYGMLRLEGCNYYMPFMFKYGISYEDKEIHKPINEHKTNFLNLMDISYYDNKSTYTDEDIQNNPYIRLIVKKYESKELTYKDTDVHERFLLSSVEGDTFLEKSNIYIHNLLALRDMYLRMRGDVKSVGNLRMAMCFDNVFDLIQEYYI